MSPISDILERGRHLVLVSDCPSPPFSSGGDPLPPEGSNIASAATRVDNSANVAGIKRHR